jgi:hypothetical protein
MYQTKIASASGRHAVDTSGANLYNIGNVSLKPGDYAMTDGRCIYGRHKNQGMFDISYIGKFLPIVCIDGTGASMIVFDSNFNCVGTYHCNNTATAFSNDIDDYVISFLNGTVADSTHIRFEISSGEDTKNNRIIGLSIHGENTYALATKGNSFVLLYNGIIVFDAGPIFDSIKNRMDFNGYETIMKTESSYHGHKLVEYTGSFQIWNLSLDRVSTKARKRVEEISNGKNNTFSNVDEYNELDDFLDKNADGGNAYFYALSHVHDVSIDSALMMSPQYLYDNGNVLISVTRVDSGKTVDTDYDVDKDTNVVTKHADAKNDPDKVTHYKGVIDADGALEKFMQDNDYVYELDGTLTASSGTGLLDGTQVTVTKAARQDDAVFCGISSNGSMLGFFSDVAQDIYIDGKAIKEIPLLLYVNSRLNWMNKKTLRNLCDLLEAKKAVLTPYDPSDPGGGNL